MGIWRNAFKLPVHPDVTAEEKAFLSMAADKIKRRSMSDIAALVLESTRPLHNLGAQLLVFLTPILNVVFTKPDTERFVKLLENPNAVSFFIETLNSGDNSAGTQKGKGA